MVSYSCTFKKKLKFTKLMIFMQQLQYKALNLMYVFPNFSGTPDPFSDGTHNYQSPRSLPLQNRGCVLKDSINIGHGKCEFRSSKSHGNWSCLQNGDPATTKKKLPLLLTEILLHGGFSFQYHGETAPETFWHFAYHHLARAQLVLVKNAKTWQ